MNLETVRQLARNPLVLSLYAPSLLASFCETMLIPVMPLFVASFEVNYGTIGLVLAMDSMGRILGDIPAGMLLRRYDRKYLMLVGMGLGTLSTALLFLAPTILTVAALRLITGMTMALFNVARHAYIIDAVSQSKRGRALALFGGLHRVAKVGSPVFAGLVAKVFGLRAPFVVYGILGIVVLILLGLYVPLLHKSRQENPAHVGHNHLLATIQKYHPVLLTAGSGQILVQMIRNGTAAIVPLFGAEVLALTVDQIGLILSVAGIVEMLMILPAGYIMDHLGRKYAIVPTFVMQAVGMALIALTAGFWGLLAAVSLIGFANGLSSGTMMTIGADLAPPEARGEFLGIWRLIGDAGFAGGPLVVGGIADLLALHTAALVLSGVGFAAAGIFIVFVPETLKKPA